jgi:adenosylcobyric acid synthase
MRPFARRGDEPPSERYADEFDYFMSGLAPVLMIQGTTSSAGKSTIVAGLCRLLSQRGLRVAPFKAQNMSNNAAVCMDGAEIGRAQFAQAIAARIEPTVDMNPILLKPQGGSSQLIVRGQVQGVVSAQKYWRERRQRLWPVVVDALDRLRASYDLVIAEGAGSPAEINLRDRDIVNMRVALHADADVLLSDKGALAGRRGRALDHDHRREATHALFEFVRVPF